MNQKDAEQEESSSTGVIQMKRLPRLTKKNLAIAGAAVAVVAIGSITAFLVFKKDKPSVSKNAQLSEQNEYIFSAVVPESATDAVKATHEQNLAQEYIRLGDDKKALEHYLKALTYVKDQPFIFQEAANLAKKVGDSQYEALYKKAYELYKKQIDADTGAFPPASYYTLAKMAVDANQRAAAKSYYEKCIEAAKKFPADDEARGYSKLATQELEKLQ